ncbi:ribonucleoside hydrolase RihC [Leminorella grimontii]|uniref:Ribonucleoside hydrolase RihC n=1 Tax=Leminorella grimontii TaxID=82981 RepID=A0AAV5MXB8_9GAMM|nr:ribonucleoside hydrolase RihC [Leminorella grimontii]KFC96323.1 inosine-uridine preferring nucleoside hydrolase [Leminorella grimontii ATCC 33999 = DSM 5078]GKX54486.1 ribonucleoside hydrolase RihC [Leminorella grimontii]VFS59130.1 Non-specific ribonucleoside hydrolase rihC [Leminorella grimontii]
MSAKRPIIIDTDPGIDDAVALGIALFARELDVKLITTVSGNVGIEHVTNNALKLLTFWTLSTPVAKGAARPLLREVRDASEVHGVTGMEGYEFPEPNRGNLLNITAVQAMYQTLKESEEKITIVAIGPLTNVALLLREYPEIKGKIAEIVLMGGALGRGNFGVLSEFNIAVDPEAAKIVFESGLAIAMTPLDVGLKALVYPQDSEEIKQMNQTGDMMYSLFRKYRGGSFNTGLKMYDSCAIAYLLKPEMFTVQNVFVAVETKGEYTSGATVIDLKASLGKAANCKVCVDIDEELFKAWFLAALKRCH